EARWPRRPAGGAARGTRSMASASRASTGPRWSGCSRGDPRSPDASDAPPGGVPVEDGAIEQPDRDGVADAHYVGRRVLQLEAEAVVGHAVGADHDPVDGLDALGPGGEQVEQRHLAVADRDE